MVIVARGGGRKAFAVYAAADARTSCSLCEPLASGGVVGALGALDLGPLVVACHEALGLQDDERGGVAEEERWQAPQEGIHFARRFQPADRVFSTR